MSKSDPLRDPFKRETAHVQREAWRAAGLDTFLIAGMDRDRVRVGRAS